MRLNIDISPNKTILPFDHSHLLSGTIHKWLGNENKWHGSIALYSYSWLNGGRKGSGGLYFPQGAKCFISAYSKDFIKTILKGILDDPDLFCGMKVLNVTIIEDPVFREETYFSVGSPVLIKKRIKDGIQHVLYDHTDAEHLMTETMITKMKTVGMDSNGVNVRFDTNYLKAHTKLVNYKGIKNKASICPVIINGTPEQLAFAWNVGVGNSTGIGFGSLI